LSGPIDRTRRGGECQDASCFCKDPQEGKKWWRKHPDEMPREDCPNLLCQCKLPLSRWPVESAMDEDGEFEVG